MSDLIDRQLAIDAVMETEPFALMDFEGKVFGSGQKTDDVIKALNNVPSSQHWTPTASHLPDPGRYLVTVKRYGRRDKNKYTTTTSVSNYYNGTWSGYDAEDVIAWMPMPEPAEGNA